MPNQKFVLECRFQQDGTAQRVETPLRIASPSMPAKPDQTIKLPEPFAPLQVQQYLPQAQLEQRVVRAESAEGKPAIRLSIEGPTQSHQRWLIAGDAQRNSLTSLIGTWRYMVVDNHEQRDELLRQFKGELRRDPRLLISKPGGEPAAELPAIEGRTMDVAGLGATVKVLRFEPNFALERESGKAMNRSDERINPAALVAVEIDGKKSEHWIFARYPDFTMKGAAAPQVRIVLDCPIESERPVPAFAIVTVGHEDHELWQRHGKVTAGPLNVDEKHGIPDSKYQFRISEYVPTGRLVEVYHRSTRGGVPALELSMTDASGGLQSIWLEAGKQRVVWTAHGAVTLGFGPQVTGSGGGHP
jgi:hypothetical protein